MKDPTHTNVFCAGIELPMCDCQYGAPMGRANRIVGYPKGTWMHLVKLRIVDGAYDAGGAYWGMGDPIYWAVSDKSEGLFPFEGIYGDKLKDRIQVFVRARNRDDAVNRVMEALPGCRIFRAKIGGRE